jgi:hypothetical protein
MSEQQEPNAEHDTKTRRRSSRHKRPAQRPQVYHVDPDRLIRALGIAFSPKPKPPITQED